MRPTSSANGSNRSASGSSAASVFAASPRFSTSHRRELHVGALHAGRDELAQPIAVSQIEHANTASRDFVFVRRPNPAPRCAERLRVRALAVEQLVVRQHEVRAIAHVQSSFDVDAVANEAVDLREQRLGIEHDAVADRTAHALVQNPARDLVQHEAMSPRSTVCPAFAPPWYRTTQSARSASTSTSLPFPSSPHCAPTTTTVRFVWLNIRDWIRESCCRRAQHIAPTAQRAQKNTPRRQSGRCVNLRSRRRVSTSRHPSVHAGKGFGK